MEQGKTSAWILPMMMFIILHATLNDAATSVSNGELEALSEDLLKSDVNNAAHLITVKLQSRVPEGNKQDKAPSRLLAVNPRAWDIPTLASLRLLFNNFEPDVRQPEKVTGIEQAEEINFINTITNTTIMEKTHNFLANKGYVSYNPDSFKDLLYDLWFGLYTRAKNRLGSSGIEHVFLGELKNGQVSGFHNWVFFSNEEMLENANYLGYIDDKPLGSKGHVLRMTFEWRNTNKLLGSMFIGTSPELELSLYTVCFLTRPNKICNLSLAGHPIRIQTHQIAQGGKLYVGSAYPA